MKKKKINSSSHSPVNRVPIRDVKDSVKLRLYVLSGGRCQFQGCNKYLLRHPLTLTDGNFGEAAHIVAFSPDGPRGQDLLRPKDINNIENIMLLCHDCHVEIDTNPDNYKVQILREYKKHHEERIYRLTETQSDFQTVILQLKSKIGKDTVAIPATQVREAVLPRYPRDDHGYILDLTTLHADGDAFLAAATDTIKNEIDRMYAPGMDVDRVRHISLFALAPIPLLIFLGSRLSNKIPVDAYQFHRDTKGWKWKTDGEPVNYVFSKLRQGEDLSKVALILSLSGLIHVEDLPSEIDKKFYVYHISLDNVTPNPMFLRLKQDLLNFEDIYRRSLRIIWQDHIGIDTIHLFPAIPAPVAVHCGYDVLPKVDPSLLVYDYDKNKGGFIKTIKVE